MSRRYKGGVISATAPTTTGGTSGVAKGVWTLPQQMQAQAASVWPQQPTPPGSQSFTTAGTFTWVVPAGLTGVSVVVVGGGQGGENWSASSCCCYGVGGRGGFTRFGNNLYVTPGESITVQVGAGGLNYPAAGIVAGGNSFFRSSGTLQAKGGSATGCNVPGAGGSGGCFGNNSGSGGGGAAGTAVVSSGGNGGNSLGVGSAGISGGGGGGGGGPAYLAGGGGGGGTGLCGTGSSGAAGATGSGGGGGSGGASGSARSGVNGGNGGAYGGGAGGGYGGNGGIGGVGAVRIVWPGNTRSFPSTCVGAP